MSNYVNRNGILDKWIRRGSYFIGLISFFGFLLYFVGRRYVEQYFGFMGIPSEELSLDFPTYAYYGANPIQLIIVIAFTLLGVGIFRLLTYHKPSDVQPPRKGALYFFKNFIDIVHSRHAVNRYLENWFFIYVALLVILYSFALPIIALIEIFGTQSTFQDLVPLMFVELMLVLFSCCVTINLLFDNKAIPRICKYGKIKTLVLWGSIFALILLPYLGSGAYASFKGYMDISLRHVDRIFDTVSFEAAIPICEKLNWGKVNDHGYQTTDTIYLVYATKENLYIKLKQNIDETIAIPKASVDSYIIKRRGFPKFIK